MKNPDLPPAERFQALVVEISKQLMYRKEAWLARWMKEYLPADLYEAGTRRERTQEIVRWLEEHDFHLRENPDNSSTQFCRGDEVLAELRIDLPWIKPNENDYRGEQDDHRSIRCGPSYRGLWV